ncbi:MAG: MutH/Sau3AI family endonuclease [Bacteroidota bacterium]
MKHITRFEATQKLQTIIGKDLRKLAQIHGITVFKNGKLNKGWAGLTLERAIGIGPDCRQASNGDFWELKLVPLTKKTNGHWKVKETMAITMINPKEVSQTPFEESHLFNKMRKMIICARARINSEETSSQLVYVNSFDLLATNFWQQIKKDYQTVQQVINQKDFHALTGKMGQLIQPRTKGVGHGSQTRAFYARVSFLETIFGIRET